MMSVKSGMVMKQDELVKDELGKSVLRIRELLKQLDSESQVLMSWIKLSEGDSKGLVAKLAVGCHKVPLGD